MHFLFLLMGNNVSVNLKVTRWESVKFQKYYHLPKISQTTKYMKHDQTALDHKIQRHILPLSVKNYQNVPDKCADIC